MSLVWSPLGIPSGHNPPDIPRTIIEPVGADAYIGPKSENLGLVKSNVPASRRT